MSSTEINRTENLALLTGCQRQGPQVVGAKGGNLYLGPGSKGAPRNQRQSPEVFWHLIFSYCTLTCCLYGMLGVLPQVWHRDYCCCKPYTLGPQMHTQHSIISGSKLAFSAALWLGESVYLEGVYRSSGTQMQNYSCSRSRFWGKQDTFHSCVSLSTMKLNFFKDVLYLKYFRETCEFGFLYYCIVLPMPCRQVDLASKTNLADTTLLSCFVPILLTPVTILPHSNFPPDL